jgi:hypothetical protein
LGNWRGPFLPFVLKWGLERTPYGWKGVIKAKREFGHPITRTGYGEHAYQALGAAAELVDEATDLIPVVSEAKKAANIVSLLSKLMEDPEAQTAIRKAVSRFGRMWRGRRRGSVLGFDGRATVVLPYGMTDPFKTHTIRIGARNKIWPGFYTPASEQKTTSLLGILEGLCY